MKMLAIATVMPMCPKSVQKKLLFNLITDTGIKLDKSELESIEHQYKDKPNCISLAHIRAWLFNCEYWDKKELFQKIESLRKTMKEIEEGKY